MVAGAGALLARAATALLGPTPAERLASAEEHARTLAERNRLARELHDSVGHALSVVTLQATAAGRLLDLHAEDAAEAAGTEGAEGESPGDERLGSARTAVEAIEQVARAALEDLDHVLGVLRESAAGTAPQPTLADLDELVRGSGARVRAEVGDVRGVPAVVSREAYRLLQEALTNAIKHGQGPVRLAAAVRDEALTLEVGNVSAARAGHGGGRGLDGMRERVRLLRGDMRAGPQGGEWQVSITLPLRSSP
ncbi:histidine kinase [Nonomuraea sp. NBC_01738]|nr:histidine kinase [Nonomuraea sp. NBC_01738]